MICEVRLLLSRIIVSNKEETIMPRFMWTKLIHNSVRDSEGKSAGKEVVSGARSR